MKNRKRRASGIGSPRLLWAAAAALIIETAGVITIWLRVNNPVAAVAVSICGQLHSVVIVRRNGEREKFSLTDPRDIAKLKQFSDELPLSTLEVSGAACSRPQVY